MTKTLPTRVDNGRSSFHIGCVGYCNDLHIRGWQLRYWCYTVSIVKQQEGNMVDKDQFEDDPRDYALELVEAGFDAGDILLGALKYMRTDDVREMLDANELSPRFLVEE